MSIEDFSSDGFTVESLWEDVLNVLLRYKKFIILVALCVSVVVYVVLQFLTNQYHTSASLIVKLGAENVEVPATVEKGSVYRQGVMKEDINTYVSVLQSRPLIEAAVERVGVEAFRHQPKETENIIQAAKEALKSVARWGREQLNVVLIKAGLRPKLDEKELVVLGISRRLGVTHVKDSNVIEVSLRFPNPILAKQVLEELISIYMETHSRVIMGEEKRVLNSLDDQMEQYRKELNTLRNELLNFKQENEIVSLEDQRLTLTNEMQQIEANALNSKRNLQENKALRVMLSDHLKEIQPMVLTERNLANSATVSKLQEQLAELQVQRTSLVTRYEESLPQITALNRQIESLQAQLSEDHQKTEIGTVFQVNPLYSELEQRLVNLDLVDEALSASILAGQTQVTELRERLEELNRAEVYIREMQMSIQVMESRFVKNAERLEEVETKEFLRARSINNVSVLIPPNYDPKPVAPRKLVFMLVGIVGGLGLGFTIALFFEWQSDRIYSIKMLRKVEGIDLLGEYKA